MATKTATNTKTLLTVKVDKQLKAKAQKTAESIGLPLGTVLNGFLRQFVQDKTVTFSAGATPTPYLAKIIDEARKDLALGKNVVPGFTDPRELIAYLHAQ